MGIFPCFLSSAFTVHKRYCLLQRFFYGDLYLVFLSAELVLHLSFAGQLADGDPEIKLTAEQLSRIDAEADKKFRRWEWIYGHSPESSFQNSRKFPCGTIEARYSLKHGVLQSLSFGGDFIGNLPAGELARKLIGLRPEDISRIDVSDYFDGLSGEQLLKLFI